MVAEGRRVVAAGEVRVAESLEDAGHGAVHSEGHRDVEGQVQVPQGPVEVPELRLDLGDAPEHPRFGAPVSRGGHPIQRVLEQRQGPRVIPEVRVAATKVARHATDAARHGASEAKLEFPLEQLHRLGVSPEHVLRAAYASEGARDQARSSDSLRDLERPDLVGVREANLPHASSREGEVVERPHEPDRPGQRVGMAIRRGVRRSAGPARRWRSNAWPRMA